ncbi:uncharacterized protein LOC122247639 [Penaeus japonicus]|uniref:uncharacterized protein LOC122247639 n=1 Tax=Penaeus japonicus TaxID=27405 RepID=UPI001C70F26F|nr:uncharacterized protein LOC122247639 [Penaeus japonicus]
MTTPPELLQPKEEDPTLGSLLETTLDLLNTTFRFDENAIDNESQGTAWPSHNKKQLTRPERAPGRAAPVPDASRSSSPSSTSSASEETSRRSTSSRRARRRRTGKQTLMLRCLALNDLVALLGSFVLMNMHLYLPVANSRWFCMLRVIWRAFGLGSGCVALVMALERWLSLTHPFTYQRIVNISQKKIYTQRNGVAKSQQETADPARESARSCGTCSRCFQVLITIFYVFGIGGNISALYFIKKSETQKNREAKTLMLRCLALNDLVALLGSFVLMNMHLYLPVANSRWFCMLRVIWRAFGLGSGWLIYPSVLPMTSSNMQQEGNKGWEESHEY